MGTWWLNLGLCACLLGLAWLCLQCYHWWLRRLGAWLFFATLGLGLWFISNNWLLVAAMILGWLCLPAAQMFYLSRTLRFTKESALTPGNLYAEGAEDLQDLTAELYDLGFIEDRDYWLEPASARHGLRLFSHHEKPVYAAIGVIQQGGLTLLYLQFATADEAGNAWITWDFPLPYNMRIPPELKVYRCLETADADELLAQHEAYLRLNVVQPGATAQLSEVSVFFNRLNEATIRYNLNAGILRNYPFTNNQLGYSWRGTWYVCRKALWEIVIG